MQGLMDLPVDSKKLVTRWPINKKNKTKSGAQKNKKNNYIVCEGEQSFTSVLKSI